MPTLWLGKEREARCEKWCVQGPLGEENSAFQENSYIIVVKFSNFVEMLILLRSD